MQDHPFPAVADGNGFQRIAGICGEAEYVNLRIGSMIAEHMLVNVPTIGLPLMMYLSYDHTDFFFNTVGYNWRHNLSMSLDIRATTVTFIADSGREYGFVLVGSDWQSDGESYFIPVTLSNPGGSLTPWRLTFPNGSYLGFDSNGTLTALADRHGNLTVLTYAAGALTTVTEPTGRTLTLAYNNGSLLTTLTDPNGNVTTFGYDAPYYDFAHYDVNHLDAFLTSITGPEGCVTSFTWDSSARIATRTDALGNTHTFDYNVSNQLDFVTDPEAVHVYYYYDTVPENVSDGAPDKHGKNQYDLQRTKMMKPFGWPWEYRFDPNANLWRNIDPTGNMEHYRWDPGNKPVQGGYPYSYNSNSGPRDSNNNSYRSNSYDSSGNLLYHVDANGSVSSFNYDANRNLLSAYPSQANFGQGTWFGRYGSQGYLLCAFDPGIDGAPPRDRSSLPPFVSGVDANGSGFVRQNFNTWPLIVTDVYTFATTLMDPRALTAPDSLERSIGLWQLDTSSGSLGFEVTLNQDVHFNLSLYSCSADHGTYQLTPFLYPEQFGRDLAFTVTDADGTQTFRMYNNAPGAWVTFPVHGNPQNPIVVTVAAASGLLTIDACISAIAFDPYDNHRTTYTYNNYNDVTSVTDGLGNRSTVDYYVGTFYDVGHYDVDRFEPNGAPLSVTDPLGRTTNLAYGDAAMNLTQITDALGNVTSLVYDANGNVLSMQNPNGHTWTYTYDGQNRVLTVTDPLNHTTEMSYDAGGNLSTVTDANNHETQFFYTDSNRLSRILDADGNSTLLSYDEAGNMTSVTNALGHKTGFQYDAASRMTAVVRPDSPTFTVTGTMIAGDNQIVVSAADAALLSVGQLVSHSALPGGTTIILVTPTSFYVNTAAAVDASSAPIAVDTSYDLYQYDGQNRMVSVTSPNGTQPDWTNLITTNAYNWLKNPGGETVDPNNSQQPQSWLGDSYSGPTSRDTTVAHSGEASFKNGTWTQNMIGVPPGTLLATRYWANTGASNNYLYMQYTDGEQVYGPQVVGTGSWQQMPWFRTTVPPASQWVGTTLKLYKSNTNSTGWFDDFELYALSTALSYDGEGRPGGVLTPDGGGWTVARDPFGRVVQMVDARGRMTQITYDAIDRVTQVVDPDQNHTTYAYDAVSNLLSFMDAKGNQTQYAYDLLDRLTRILYPDASTETFTYDPASNLLTYTNNRSQQRTFSYDVAERLSAVTYNTDSTQVSFTYDAVGNVLTRTERNSDVTTYSYDALDRVVTEERKGVASSSPSWEHAHTWDAAGNRVAFNMDAGFRYNSAYFNHAAYGSKSFTWSIPGGYNPMELPTAYQDRNGKATSFSYDVESRLKQITFPVGTAGNPTTTHSVDYDVVGKVVSLATVNGSTTLLSAGYGYDAAGNRLGLVVGNDTFDYGIDDAGQLVEECVNRFVERRTEHFENGTVSNLVLNASSNSMSLLPFNDDLSGPSLHADRWLLGSSPMPGVVGGVTALPDYVGLEVRQNNGLEFAFPRGYTHMLPPYNADNCDGYGMRTDLAPLFATAANRNTLSGDFDVQVDFSDFQYQLSGVSGTTVQTGLYISDLVYGANPQNSGFVSIQQIATGHFYTARQVFPITGTIGSGSSNITSVSSADTARLYVGAPVSHPALPAGTTVSTIGSTSFMVNHNATANASGATILVTGQATSLVTPDNLGSLRAVRSGSTLTLYIWNGGWVNVASYSSFPTGAVYVSLLFLCNVGGVGSVRFRNFTLNSPAAQYPASGTYTSAIYDAGRTSGLSWDTLSWLASTPPGTQLMFQVASSSTPTPASWSYVGPDNTSSTYFIASPATMTSLSGINPGGTPNRYIRYQATLVGNGTATPTLYRTDIQFAGTTASTLTTYDIDQPLSLYDYANCDQAALDTLNSSWYDSTSFYDIAHCDQDSYDSVNGSGDGTADDVNALCGQAASGNISRKVVENASGVSTDVRDHYAYNSSDRYAFATSDRINNLNQINRQDLNSASGNTTWKFEWDLSGNMTSKTPTFSIIGTLGSGSNNVTSVSASDIARLYVGAPVAHADLPGGTTVSTISSSSFTVSHNATANATAAVLTVTGTGTTTYSWDEDNRLTQVAISGGATITYGYDVLGRMLTRTHSVNGTTRFEWDSWSIVREYAPAPTGTAVYDTAHCDGSDNYGWWGVTNYYMLNSRLCGMDFDNATIAVIADAMGHVRLLVDANGNTTFSASYDAWGNVLSSLDTTPGGCSLTYAGGLGVRQDPTIGLLYMRQRWYDPALGRFVSRDQIFADNLYSYANNGPTWWIDPSGFTSGDAPSWHGGVIVPGHVSNLKCNKPNCFWVCTRSLTKGGCHSFFVFGPQPGAKVPGKGDAKYWGIFSVYHNQGEPNYQIQNNPFDYSSNFDLRCKQVCLASSGQVAQLRSELQNEVDVGTTGPYTQGYSNVWVNNWLSQYGVSPLDLPNGPGNARLPGTPPGFQAPAGSNCPT